MPLTQAPIEELGNAPESNSLGPSPSPSDVSSTTSSASDPVLHVRAPPLFHLLAMRPPDPEQPEGQEELERRLPGYRRIVIPRDLTLIEHLKQSSGVETDDEVLSIREAKLQVIAERVGLRRLNILAPRLRSLTLDGSAIASLRDLGIGMTHLKFLSVNRCGLTSLDGIWGLHSLRELHATRNKIADLQPLAVLQKLHTLDLADNPVTAHSGLWTIAICSSLRRLTLIGTPLAESSTYRTNIASTLPMLIYLDDRTMHNDIDFSDDTSAHDPSDDTDNVAGEMSSSSDSEEEEDLHYEELFASKPLPPPVEVIPSEPVPGPSCSSDLVMLPDLQQGPRGDAETVVMATPRLRRRPATTETIGPRPERPILRQRPHTAQTTNKHSPLTRLEIMNTLLDDEWRCTGSSLTSREPFCGNLAQALRRPSNARRSNTDKGQNSCAEAAMASAEKTLAAEIPKVPTLESWARFREATGIDIDIDFSKRPPDIDPDKAIERLERIERETSERLKYEVAEKSKEVDGITEAQVDANRDDIPNVGNRIWPAHQSNSQDYEETNDMTFK